MRIVQEAQRLHTLMEFVAQGIGVAIIPDPFEHVWMPRGSRDGPESAVQQVQPLLVGCSRAVRRKERRILRRARI